MKEIKDIQLAATDTVNIVVEGRGKWTLCLDYRALAKIKKETGIDLLQVEQWKALLDTGNEAFPKIVWCCLVRYSPEVTLEQVLDGLNPQAHAILWAQLFDLAFPNWGAAHAEYLAQKGKEGASPKSLPDPRPTA